MDRRHEARCFFLWRVVGWNRATKIFSAPTRISGGMMQQEKVEG
jgi:hypothetical protein